MYQRYYSMQEKAFPCQPTPTVFFESPIHRGAAHFLLSGMADNEPFLLVMGNYGMGKTLLCLRAIRHLADTGSPFVDLATPVGSYRELLDMLLIRLGIAPHGGGEDELQAQFLRLIHEHASRQQTFTILLDEVQDYPPATLGKVRMLSNYNVGGFYPIQFIFFAHPAIVELLRQPILEPLDQRIRHRYLLTPFALEETKEYIYFRLIHSGASGSPYFPDESVLLIHQASRGIPRYINNICDSCLLHGATRKLATIDPETVREAIAAVGIATDAPPAATPPPASLPAAGPPPAPASARARDDDDELPAAPPPRRRRLRVPSVPWRAVASWAIVIVAGLLLWSARHRLAALIVLPTTDDRAAASPAPQNSVAVTKDKTPLAMPTASLGADTAKAPAERPGTDALAPLAAPTADLPVLSLPYSGFREPRDVTAQRVLRPLPGQVADPQPAPIAPFATWSGPTAVPAAGGLTQSGGSWSLRLAEADSENAAMALLKTFHSRQVIGVQAAPSGRADGSWIVYQGAYPTPEQAEQAKTNLQLPEGNVIVTPATALGTN